MGEKISLTAKLTIIMGKIYFFLNINRLTTYKSLTYATQ